MKRSIIAIAIAAALAATGCASATAEQPEQPGTDFKRVHDLYFAPREPSGFVRVMKNQAEKAEQAERDAAEAAAAAEAEQVVDYYYTEPYVPSQQPVRGNPDGLNSFDGVNEYNGKTEKFYPESAGRHVNTDQWHEDEQGFYRTDEGYYVVASDEYEHGTVIDTSQGKAQVLDSGAGEGVVDFYVNW